MAECPFAAVFFLGVVRETRMTTKKVWFDPGGVNPIINAQALKQHAHLPKHGVMISCAASLRSQWSANLNPMDGLAPAASPRHVGPNKSRSNKERLSSIRTNVVQHRSIASYLFQNSPVPFHASLREILRSETKIQRILPLPIWDVGSCHSEYKNHLMQRSWVFQLCHGRETYTKKMHCSHAYASLFCFCAGSK